MVQSWGRSGSVARAATLAAAATWYCAFIWRGSFVFDGKRYFTLFDDAMIAMRYANNLVGGHGLVWNPGESPRVEGYTNLLWTLLMAAYHALPIPEGWLPAVVAASGAVCVLVTAVLAERLVRAAGGGSAAQWAATAATAFCYPLVYWSLRGMEVGFVAMLVVGGALVAVRPDRSTRSLLTLLLIFAALVFTRDDAVVPAAGIAFAFVVFSPASLRRRCAVIAIVGLAATILVRFGFRLAYYGELVPNTYDLKIGGTSVAYRFASGVEKLRASFATQLAVLLAFAVAAMVALPWSLVRWFLSGIVALQLAYSVYVGGDAWEAFGFSNRYITTGLPVLIVLAALGAEALVRKRRASIAFAAVVVVAVVSVAATPIGAGGIAVRMGAAHHRVLIGALIAAAILGWAARASAPWVAPSGFAALAIVSMSAVPLVYWWPAGPLVEDDRSMSKIGLELREATASDATIAIVWAGSMPYYSNREAIDLLGKTDKVIAHGTPRLGWFYPGHTKWDYEHSIVRRQPDVVLQLWFPSEADFATIKAAGYTALGPTVFVREGSTRVDRGRLRTALRPLGVRGA